MHLDSQFNLVELDLCGIFFPLIYVNIRCIFIQEIEIYEVMLKY